MNSIGMYASFQNIAGKNDEKIEEVSRLRISDLNIGLQSDLSDVLGKLKKGFTLDEAKFQLKRLKKAGIGFSVNLITDVTGGERWREYAVTPAQVANDVKHDLIFIATLHR